MASRLFFSTWISIYHRSQKEEAGNSKNAHRMGDLVEIDKNIIAARGKKITNNELKNWIKKSSTN